MSAPWKERLNSCKVKVILPLSGHWVFAQIVLIPSVVAGCLWFQGQLQERLFLIQPASPRIGGAKPLDVLAPWRRRCGRRAARATQGLLLMVGDAGTVWLQPGVLL